MQQPTIPIAQPNKCSCFTAAPTPHTPPPSAPPPGPAPGGGTWAWNRPPPNAARTSSPGPLDGRQTGEGRLSSPTAKSPCGCPTCMSSTKWPRKQVSSFGCSSQRESSCAVCEVFSGGAASLEQVRPHTTVLTLPLHQHCVLLALTAAVLGCCLSSLCPPRPLLPASAWCWGDSCAWPLSALQ